MFIVIITAFYVDTLIYDYLWDADVYLAGTVMLIFGMGLYGLFISNVPHDVPSNNDRALKGSSLFGMFALKVILISFLCMYMRHSRIYSQTFTDINRC